MDIQSLLETRLEKDLEQYIFIQEIKSLYKALNRYFCFQGSLSVRGQTKWSFIACKTIHPEEIVEHTLVITLLDDENNQVKIESEKDLSNIKKVRITFNPAFKDEFVPQSSLEKEFPLVYADGTCRY